MTMLPVHERVMQEIVRRLLTITVANGYSFDALVQRPKFADESLLHDPNAMIVSEAGPSKVDDRSGNPQGFIRLQHRVQIVSYLDAPQDATESVYTTRARVHGDIVRALDLDPSSATRFFGGLADQASFVSAEPPDDAPSGAAACHISIEFEVRVRQSDHALQ